MSFYPLSPITKPLRMGLLIAGLAGLLTAAMAWVHVARERRIDLEDIDRRAHVLLYQLAPAVREVLAQPDQDAATALAPQVEG